MLPVLRIKLTTMGSCCESSLCRTGKTPSNTTKSIANSTSVAIG